MVTTKKYGILLSIMDEIEEVLTRGVANIIPNRKTLEKALTERKLNIYLGIDPTAPKIHLGHAVSLRMLQKFVDLGHQVTFLIGDFTSLVGDTSDKESERPILTQDEISANFQTYKQQAEKILDFSKVTVRRNSEWLKGLTFADIIKLTQNFSLNDFISRELIRRRLDEGKNIRLDEVIYPIMQGYDSYTMDTDLQIGGTDQTFNMQAGRTLMKNLKGKESFVLTTEFLLGTDGRKMSKSWGNAIWLDDSPEDMFGKVMSISDDLIVQYFLLGTNLPFTKVKKVEQRLAQGENPMSLKKELAQIIVSELHSSDIAEKAKQNFESTVQHGEIPEVIQTLTTGAGVPVLDFLVDNGLVGSRSEAKRLIEQKAVTMNDQEITPASLLDTNGILQYGKRKYVRIEVKS